MPTQNPGSGTIRVGDVDGVNIPQVMVPVGGDVAADVGQPTGTPVAAGGRLLGQVRAESGLETETAVLVVVGVDEGLVVHVGYPA